MATFAELDSNNVIINVIKVANSDCGGGNFPESEPIGIEYLNNLFGPGRIWKQGSVRAAFRGNRPSCGNLYDPQLDAFLPKKEPFMEGYVIDPTTYRWWPPLPHPDDGIQPYMWSLDTKQWEPVPKPYPSWVLPPMAKPVEWVSPTRTPPDYDGTNYNWDEATLSWIKV